MKPSEITTRTFTRTFCPGSAGAIKALFHTRTFIRTFCPVWTSSGVCVPIPALRKKMNFTESIVEDAALSWFGELDYVLLSGQTIAPGEADAERTSFGEAFLPERLRAALRKLNPKLPAEALGRSVS